MNGMVTGGSPSVLRGLNLLSTLQHVRDQGPASKADLIRMTGLSRPTINEVVEELLSRGLVRAIGRDGSHGVPGAVRSLYSFNVERSLLLGIDIGSRQTILLVADLSGEVIAKRRVVMDAHHGTQSGIALVRQEISQLFEDHDLDLCKLSHAAVCVPGVVDPDTGRLTLAPQLPALNGVEVGGLLGLSCPTSVENEMRSALLGEQWRGSARASDSIVYVGLGVGIGAAFMLQGRLYSGHRGTAGEIGYLNPGGALERPAIDEMGPLEKQAGAAALTARGEAVAKANPASQLATLAAELGEMTPTLIANAAKLGDDGALGLLRHEATLLAQALGTLSIVLDPEMVVVGGGLAQAGDVLLAPLREELSRIVPGKAPAIVEGLLGEEGAAVGAVCLAMKATHLAIEEELRKE